MPTVSSFRNNTALMQHFIKHGAEFGATTKEDYLAKAKAFLGADLADNPDILECVTKSGVILRYKPSTNEYGIVEPSGIIKTYFKPDPAEHKLSSNLDFFRVRCSK